MVKRKQKASYVLALGINEGATYSPGVTQYHRPTAGLNFLLFGMGRGWDPALGRLCLSDALEDTSAYTQTQASCRLLVSGLFYS